MDLKVTEEEGDSIRLALTALSALLVAYMHRFGIRDTDKIISSFQTVSLFADKFVTAADANARLYTLDKDYFPADPHQINLQYLSALLPVVANVADFAFGENDQKRIQDITSTLIARATDITAQFFANLSGADKARTELSILRALATIYGDCHTAQTKMIGDMDDNARKSMNPAQMMDQVWKNFDARVDLLKGLLGYLGDSDAQTSRGGSSKKPAVAAPAAQEVAAPAASAPPAAAQSAGSSSPMSFFSKK